MSQEDLRHHDMMVKMSSFFIFNSTREKMLRF